MGFSAPDPPDLPPPPDPAPPDPNLDEIARQRAEIERRRRGRSSLRIEPSTNAPGGTGLRIPENL